MKNYMESANDYYSHYIGSETFHEFGNDYLLSEGIFNISGEEECFWLLQILVSNQKFLEHYSFQSWTLKREEDLNYTLLAINSKENIIFQETVPTPDFFFRVFTIWKINNVFFLPSEYRQLILMQEQRRAKNYEFNYFEEGKPLNNN